MIGASAWKCSGVRPNHDAFGRIGNCDRAERHPCLKPWYALETLDEVFAEARNQSKNAAENPAWLRRVALSLRKQTPLDQRTLGPKGNRRAMRSDDGFLDNPTSPPPKLPENQVRRPCHLILR